MKKNKILCVVSANPGHIDLGGNGFISVANELSDNGQEVIWLSRAGQVDRLKKLQQNVSDESTIPHLWLYANTLNAKSNPKILNTICQSLIAFKTRLESIKPDIIIFDRVLTLGALAAKQLEIPYISIGSPGGYWSNESGYLQPHNTPIDTYVEIEQLICNKLQWRVKPEGSFWLDSPYINICFIASPFYTSIKSKFSTTAYVNNFSDLKDKLKTSNNIGISFGNTGSIELMTHILDNLHNSKLNIASTIDVYTGNRPDLIQQLKRRYIKSNTNIHGWIDYSNQLQKHKFFIFMGGIGTIWHCLNQNVPMCIIPSRMTDQVFNSQVIGQLGLGEFLLLDKPDANAVINTIKKIDKNSEADQYKNSIRQLRAEKNFSDTIKTICEKICSLISQ
ncbi:MAG: glycosyltransferase [Methylococcales bacterium]